MTDAELIALEALCDAATSGPWEEDASLDVCGEWSFAVLHKHDAFEYIAVDVSSPENARFIAAARTAVPALIAEVRRLRGEMGKNPC